MLFTVLVTDIKSKNILVHVSIPTECFILSNRGKPMLLIEGWQYHKHRSNKDGSSRWRCTTTPCCKAFIKLDPDQTIVGQVPHDDECKPNLVANEIRKEKAQWKSECLKNYRVKEG